MGEIVGLKIFSASGLAKRGPGYLCGVFIATSAHNMVVKFYDNTEGNGTLAFIDFVQVAGGSSREWLSLNNPIPFSRGLYIEISNTGANDMVGVQVV